MTTIPCWSVPVEMVKHSASATGFAFMFRWEAKGAVFRPEAKVFRRNGHLVASIDFVEPIGPEKMRELQIILVPPLQENAEPDSPAELPPLGCDRWTPQRKLAVVQAWSEGRLTLEAAEASYGIQAHEIQAWANAYDRRGVDGLAVHKIQSGDRA